MMIENLSFCKDDVIQYVDDGTYYSECAAAIDAAQTILTKRIGVLNLTVVLDIDDTAIELYGYWKSKDFAGTNETITESFIRENEPALPGVKSFYDFCINNNVNVIFLTGRSDKYRNTTTQLIKNAGYVSYLALDMKPESLKMKDAEFKTMMVDKYQAQGLVIATFVDDQKADMNNTADYKCLIPNKWYDVSAYEKALAC
jgi:predicted secreted acid phosphatase